MALSDTTTFTPEREGIGSLPLYSEPETVASGQNLARLTMVGRIAASGKVIKSVRTATDGSQTPIGFTAEEINAAADAACPIYKQGGFDSGAIVLDASWTLAQARAAFDRTPISIGTPLSLAAG
jgi:hypothetical protein